MTTQNDASSDAKQTVDEHLRQRIVETADIYHFTAEEQWEKVVDAEPTGEDSVFEFRRIIRAALQFYARAYLMLGMQETDDEQQLEDLLEISVEQDPTFGDFVGQNQVFEVLDEESNENVSRVFSVAESLRSFYLDRSNKLAASLGQRFPTV